MNDEDKLGRIARYKGDGLFFVLKSPLTPL